MYFPVGWPKVLRNYPPNQNIRQIVANRDKILFAILSNDTLSIWFCKPSVALVVVRRSEKSLQKLGGNVAVEWKPDSSMICVATEEGWLILYAVSEAASGAGVGEPVSCYTQHDPPAHSLRRDSAQLFSKQLIPSLTLCQVHEVSVQDGRLTRVACISSSELVLCTSSAHVLRYRWDGTHNRDYALDLARIPFSLDQQLSKAVPITERDTYVSDLEYSPLVCGFGITLNDGRAAYLTAPNLKFDPNQVQGIWAPGVVDATCVRVNHKFRLIAVGRSNSQVSVFSIDEVSGGLELSHNLQLSSKDFPRDPGAVSCIRYTSEGRALCVCWQSGGYSVWSTFGALLACELAWHESTAPPVFTALEWACEGYQLWMVRRLDAASSLLQQDFVKSPLASNPAVSKMRDLYVQGDTALYVNTERSVSGGGGGGGTGGCDGSVDADCRKQWLVLPLPYNYIHTNWPLRYSAMDESGRNVVVAGMCGLAHYNTLARKWKLFGSETHERDVVVAGGLLWWRNYIIAGCYCVSRACAEVRVWAREARLSERGAGSTRLGAQASALSVSHDTLLVLSADALVTLYTLSNNDVAEGSVGLEPVQAVDVSGLCDPACVVSAELCRLHDAAVDSLVINASGRLMMVQREYTAPEQQDNLYRCLPGTVLADSVESVWSGGGRGSQLSSALWLWCGALGARVWLPLAPRDTPAQPKHTFMTKRIMLPFHLDIYPLAILFDEAILLGAETDTTFYSSDADAVFSLPFCVLNRTSQVYLHQILRQLLRRNLGYQAWQIARSCSHLAYFPHALELLLHEVLEEEATSKEPLPDAQLPSVIEFVHEFPVYLQTVVQCARKTEIALWNYLFSAAGKPKDLFQECLRRNLLDTAASYLIILQNVESAATSRQLATALLDTALRTERWGLLRDLVRFLRAIDPNDVESPRNSLSVINKYAHVPPDADHLAVILGSVQFAGRGRSFSTTATPRGELESGSAALPASRAAPPARKKSVPTSRDHKESAEVPTEALMARHARRLLAAGRLLALGRAAAALDLPLVAWLASERERAARIDNAVACLKRVHEDFSWPYPTLRADLHAQALADSTLLGVTAENSDADSINADSGYTSLLRHNLLPDSAPLSELRSVGDVSVAEGGSVWDGDCANDARDAIAQARPDNSAHIQLRYLLQLMTEAGCVEWCLVLAVCLRDAMAVLRCTNAARSADVSVEAVRRLRRALQDICAWTDCECLGYKPFMLAISNQVAFLTSVLSARERTHSLRRRSSVSAATRVDNKSMMTVCESGTAAAPAAPVRTAQSPAVLPSPSPSPRASPASGCTLA